jgi:hypothetical protein
MDDQRACRLALGPRLLLGRAVTPVPTGRVTGLAMKQSRAPEPVDLPPQPTAIPPAHCARRSFGRRAELHLETVVLDEGSGLAVVRRPSPSGQ